MNTSGTLEKWFVIYYGDAYTPPEERRVKIQGRIYNSEKFADGEEVTISRIISSEGRFVTTYSGSVYELGAVDKAYLDWLSEEGFEYDRKNPIKVIL